jgi:hypothetical protein
MRRLISILAAAIGGTVLMGLGPLPAVRVVPQHVAPVKLGFEQLTADQVADLWKRADNYAMAEAFFRQCDRPLDLENRMRAAARDCISEEALGKVARYFRAKVADYGKRHVFDCSSPKARELVRDARGKIDREVEEVRSMCRSCLIC